MQPVCATAHYLGNHSLQLPKPYMHMVLVCINVHGGPGKGYHARSLQGMVNTLHRDTKKYMNGTDLAL
jgi:hypothetical protein